MNYEINILVDGKPVSEYLDPNSTTDRYIEGREGKSYQIELKNNTWDDAEFVVSIDGLSITDGKPAGRESSGYLVRGRSSTVIDGWLVDSDTAAKFTFANKKSSYAEASGQGTDNTGVIGVRVFTKKYVAQTIYHFVEPNPWQPWKPVDDRFWNLYPTYTSLTAATGMGYNADVPVAMAAAPMERSATGPTLDSFQMPEEVSSLGTEFGEATKMSTTKTNFERASTVPAYEKTLFYATYKELNRLGIVTDWQKKAPAKKPQAFPADYCKPPEGWQKKG